MAAQVMSWKRERQRRRSQPKNHIAVNEAELDMKSMATQVRESDTSDFTSSV